MSADRLRRLEKVVDASRRRFCETGAEPRKIRDEKLCKVALFEEIARRRREWKKTFCRK